jgi:hypothetical protein
MTAQAPFVEEMHGAAGFWCLPFVLMWAVSGIYLVFQDQFVVSSVFLDPAGRVAPWLTQLHLPLRCDAQLTNVGAVGVRRAATPPMRSASRQAIGALSCMCPSGSDQPVANCRRRRPPPPPDSAWLRIFSLLFRSDDISMRGHVDCQENKLTSEPTAAQAHPVCAPPRTSAD